MIRHEGLQLCFGSLNWIELVDRVPAVPGFPAKFGKTPSLEVIHLEVAGVILR